jgi:hypothetical protein
MAPGNTRQIRYVPNGQNDETATFTYKAWDQTSGTASTNATPRYASTAIAGGTTAFSTNNATGQIVVSSVNDAPTITSGAIVNFSSVNEDTTSVELPISAFLSGPSWADVDTGAVGGMAITSATGNGNWQYSTDGITWANFGSVSGTNSLLINSTSQIRYVPNGQNGETATFTYKAWDETSGIASTNSTPSYASTASAGGKSSSPALTMRRRSPITPTTRSTRQRKTRPLAAHLPQPSSAELLGLTLIRAHSAGWRSPVRPAAVIGNTRPMVRHGIVSGQFPALTPC